jgi:branched-chain amino acid transport system substrate-binding protein
MTLFRAGASLALGLPLVVGCGPADDGRDPNAISVGLVAPFTGEFAAPGANIERAMLTLKHIVNDAGGVAGHPLAIHAVDSRSDVPHGLESARSLAADPSVLAFIGPDYDELVAAMQEEVMDSSWAHILPGITALDLAASNGRSRFRIGPLAEGLGCALAERMYDLGYRKVVVLNGPDSTSQGFGEAIGSTLDGYGMVGRASWTRIDVSSSSRVIDDALDRVQQLNPDAIVVAASAELGIQIVQNSVGSSKLSRKAWFLSPSLLNQAVVVNILPGTLEGAIGVAPAVAFQDDATGLAEQVEARFGDEPFINSYYYYDAMALAVLAIEAAAYDAGAIPTRAQVAAQIRRVARAPGHQVRWNQIPEGLDILRSGGDVDYVGITGNLSLDSQGDTDQDSMHFRQEKIEGNHTVFEAYRVCVPIQ